MLTALLVENPASISSTYMEVLITGESVPSSGLRELLHPHDPYTLAQAYIHTHKI